MTPDDFIITFIGDWSDEEKNAFNYAAGIWSALIDPVVKISINAYDDASCPFCGGYAYIYINYFSGMPRPETLYSRAQANQLAGYDLLPDEIDFDIKYSGDAYDWYFGTDGNPLFYQVDFVTVILHEIAHGLGLITSFNMGSYGSLYGYPYFYDTFMENAAGEILIEKYLPLEYSADLEADIISDEIYFDGLQTRLKNQNLPGRLQAGRDVHCSNCIYLEHLNDDFYQDSTNELMTSLLNPGEAIHDPGPVTLGMLADLGWSLSPNLPVFYPLPSQMLRVDTQRLLAIDLWKYIPAYQAPETNFIYTITNTPAAGAGVSLSVNRYIDINPLPGWVGRTQVTVTATNLQGLSASQTFQVIVTSEIYLSWLPSVSR
jgi:hypothetical protein